MLMIIYFRFVKYNVAYIEEKNEQIVIPDQQVIKSLQRQI